MEVLIYKIGLLAVIFILSVYLFGFAFDLKHIAFGRHRKSSLMLKLWIYIRETWPIVLLGSIAITTLYFCLQTALKEETKQEIIQEVFQPIEKIEISYVPKEANEMTEVLSLMQGISK